MLAAWAWCIYWEKGAAVCLQFKKKIKNQRRSPLKTVAVDNIGLARKPCSWSQKLKKNVYLHWPSTVLGL